MHNSILLAYVHELHCNRFVYPPEVHFYNIETDTERLFVDQLRPPIWTRIYGTAHCDHHLAGNYSSNEYFNIFDDEIYLYSFYSWMEKYQSVHWCIKHKLNRAAFNELLWIPTMAIISNFTLSCNVFQRLNEASYRMGIDSGTSCKVNYSHQANPNNLHANSNTRFFDRKLIDPIALSTQHHTFMELMW